MNEQRTKPFDRLNAIIAGSIWLFCLMMYVRTQAPTFSFWDCGEFVAATTTLGIPHPPGSPLYILFGRIFSMTPLWSDIAVRVNFFSGFSSAFTALFSYLSIVRILRVSLSADSELLSKYLPYAGGISGALFAAFSLTNWLNSVEAEVYGFTLALCLAVFWLSLVYWEHKGTAFSNKLLVLIIYIAYLGIGVHMTIYLFLPVVALFFILQKNVSQMSWLLVGGVVLSELYMIFALSSRPGEIAYYVPVVIVALLYFFYMFSFEMIPKVHFVIGGGFLASILPLFSYAISGLSNTNRQHSSNDIALWIGLISFAILNLFALWLLLNPKRKHKTVDRAVVIGAVFVLVASAMIALLYLPKGYEFFLLVAGIPLVVFLYMIRSKLNYTTLIALVGLSGVVIGIYPMIYGIVISALIVAFVGFSGRYSGWKTALVALFIAVIGFSVHLFIPIRSAQQPVINENNPSESIRATVNFLERKQYGSESMVERMFKRRAEWSSQFGDFRRMGFWRFFTDQYGVSGSRSVVFILLGFFGLWEVIRRRSDLGIPLVLLILLTSVGLILYMNFADGSRQLPGGGGGHLEVRDRDYFFTPAFVLFGMAIGIGIAMVVQTVHQSLATRSDSFRRAGIAVACLLFFLPIITIAGNYHRADRSRNYIPYDYGWNLLSSCDKDAILFTHGDNDTFPLWALQEAYGLRKDVRVVNLSLANTKWYIKQIVHTMGLDLKKTDAEIDAMRPYRASDGAGMRLQDQVIDALVDNYYGKRPIYFSVTVGSSARKYRGRPVDHRLQLVGMLWEFADVETPLQVDVERTFEYFSKDGRFMARGVNDPTIYQDEATSRLTRNYANAFLMLADTLKKAGDLEKAEEITRKAIYLIPQANDPVEFLAALFSEQGRLDDLDSLISSAKAGDVKLLKVLLGRGYRMQKQPDEAERILKETLRDNPTFRPALEELMRLYFEGSQVLQMKQLLQQWLQFNPRDERISGMLRELKAGIQTQRQGDSL